MISTAPQEGRGSVGSDISHCEVFSEKNVVNPGCIVARPICSDQWVSVGKLVRDVAKVERFCPRNELLVGSV
jgi:hypothetical protein